MNSTAFHTLFLLLSIVTSYANAEPIASYSGDADPVSEGWILTTTGTTQGPGADSGWRIEQTDPATAEITRFFKEATTDQMQLVAEKGFEFTFSLRLPSTGTEPIGEGWNIFTEIRTHPDTIYNWGFRRESPTTISVSPVSSGVSIPIEDDGSEFREFRITGTPIGTFCCDTQFFVDDIELESDLWGPTALFPNPPSGPPLGVSWGIGGSFDGLFLRDTADGIAEFGPLTFSAIPEPSGQSLVGVLLLLPLLARKNKQTRFN